MYRVADLYGYDYDTETTRNAEGKEEQKHFCTLQFRNTTGMYAPRIEIGSMTDFIEIEKYFNKLFGIQKTLRNAVNNAKRQMDASVYGDRTEWIKKADAALEPFNK